MAAVLPLLKKANLEITLKNFRPVSNLEFVGKLLERAVVSQLVDYLDTNMLFEEMQSAYRKNCSTETALLRVYNDFLMSIDDQQCVLLVLLDLSAVFDTVDHNILLSRLATRFGITGNALKWVESYLSERSQYVTVNGVKSTTKELLWGVPQGSVLGPILFILYTSPLGDIVRIHNLLRIKSCIDDIRNWLVVNKLKGNDDKTVALIMGTKSQLQKLIMDSIEIGDSNIQFVSQTKNL